MMRYALDVECLRVAVEFRMAFIEHSAYLDQRQRSPS